MKIKSVLAGFAAAAVLSATAMTAFAETDSKNDRAAVNGANGAMIETVAETATTETDTNTNTSAEGVVAVFGVVALAGAAVVMSRKKA